MNMIVDRTSADVERWKELRNKGWVNMTEDERREWLGEIVPIQAASKGMYTHNDLNRVERAVESIVGRFESLGYCLSSIRTKTDWTYRDAFWSADMERYYKNIILLRESLTVYRDTPNAPKVGETMTYEIANNIEKILMDIDELYVNLIKSWYYSGDVISGEV